MNTGLSQKTTKTEGRNYQKKDIRKFPRKHMEHFWFRLLYYYRLEIQPIVIFKTIFSHQNGRRAVSILKEPAKYQRPLFEKFENPRIHSPKIPDGYLQCSKIWDF